MLVYQIIFEAEAGEFWCYKVWESKNLRSGFSSAQTKQPEAKKMSREVLRVEDSWGPFQFCYACLSSFV